MITFLYPGVLPLIPSLLQSLNAQTTKEFVLLVFNDGVKDAASHFEGLSVGFEIIEVDGSPMDNRFYAMNFLKDSKYNAIVCQDADDLLSPNRVEASLATLREHVLVVNDLDLIDGQGHLMKRGYWKQRLEHNFVFNATFLRNKNIVGLGNTSFRRSLLQYPLIKPDITVTGIDWFIFYQLLLLSGEKGIFIHSASTLYRQHEENIIGLDSVSPERLKLTIEAKLKHYLALESIGTVLEEELNEIKDIQQKGIRSIEFSPAFNLFWWEETNHMRHEGN